MDQVMSHLERLDSRRGQSGLRLLQSLGQWGGGSRSMCHTVVIFFSPQAFSWLQI